MVFYAYYSLIEGRLAEWTKGFACSGVEGEDVVDLLKKAIDKRGDVDIDVCAILNDTTGQLIGIPEYSLYSSR